MRSFVHESLPVRVVFGPGSLAGLPDEVGRLGIERALVISTRGHRHWAEAATAELGARAAGICDRAVMHTPIETAIEARATARELSADGCVAIGGGSTLGLAKAVALELGLPIIAVPTTYAGSEMTAIQGITADGVKRTRRDPRMLPRTVIYDPELTVSLPAAIAGPSAMNGIAHCVEALYAANATPITALMAEEGIRALATALPRVITHPADLDARAQALYGAWLASYALGASDMGLHHKLCHVVGGSFDLPHAQVHTVILPHATAYNRAAAPEAMGAIARALGVDDDPAGGLFDLAVGLGARTALADLGMAAADLEKAADLAVANPYANPSPVTREGLRALLDDAFHGHRPTA